MGSILTLLLGELLSLSVIAKAIGWKASQLVPWDILRPALIAATSAATLTFIFEQFFLSTLIILLFMKAIIYTVSFVSLFLLAGGKRHIMPLIKNIRINAKTGGGLI